jgi:hypothetical protein
MTRKHPIWGSRLGLQREIITPLQTRVERDLLALMTSPPPALSIPRLVDGDPVDPRAECRLASETMNGPKDAEEDFLRQIERLVAIAEQMAGQSEDHPMMLGNEERAGVLIPRCAALHEQGFTPCNLGPAGCAGVLYHKFPCHRLAISQTISGKDKRR